MEREYNYTNKDPHMLCNTHTHTIISRPPGRPPPPCAAPLYNARETKSLKWRNKQNKQKYTRWKKKRDNKRKMSLVDHLIPPPFFSYYFICLLLGHLLHFSLFLLLLFCVSQILVILKCFRLLLWSHLESEKKEKLWKLFWLDFY